MSPIHDIETLVKNTDTKSEDLKLIEETLAQVYDSLVSTADFNQGALQELLITPSINDAFQPSFLSRIATIAPKEVFDNSTWTTTVYSTELHLSIPIGTNEKHECVRDLSTTLLNYFLVQYNKFFTDVLETFPTDKVITSGLDLPIYSKLRSTLADKYALPVTYFFLSGSLWSYVFGNTVLLKVLDPTSKHKELLRGTLGNGIGTEWLTDAFYHPLVKYFTKGQALLTNLTQESVILHNLGTCSIDSIERTSTSVELSITFSLEAKADTTNKFGSYSIEIM